ncbi:MAG: hypothetical protein ABSG64_08665 [Solirubrobacteraceae bacterium]|jgi:hypothetical protein
MRHAYASRAIPTYQLHGLHVRSAARLDAPVVDAPDCDIEIRWGERRAIPHALPGGELLSRLDLPEGSSSLTADADGYVWRVADICDFVVDRARRDACIHLAPGVDEELASLLAGSFLAKMLALAGRCVLHSSAVEVDGRAVAFIGGSGTGKTTVAALCCVAGARVVTDDVLRVELRDGKGWCFSGSGELRLRPGAAALAEHLAFAPRRSTIDERTAVAPAVTVGGTFPLAALLAPRLSEDFDELRVERLRGSAALLELLRAPRTIGWVSAEPAQHDLGVLAGLAESVPVYLADLPWRQPVDAELGRRLLDRIGLEVHDRRVSPC